MADYYNNNASYAGVYTEKEKAWLTILRYGGFLLFGAGIYGFVSRRLPVAVSVVALVLAVVCTKGRNGRKSTDPAAFNIGKVCHQLTRAHTVLPQGGSGTVQASSDADGHMYPC